MQGSLKSRGLVYVNTMPLVIIAYLVVIIGVLAYQEHNVEKLLAWATGSPKSAAVIANSLRAIQRIFDPFVGEVIRTVGPLIRDLPDDLRTLFGSLFNWKKASSE